MALGRADQWASIPGIQTAVESYEAAFRWGQYGVGIITPGYINAATIDSGNTPTWELRPGLVLGQKSVDGSWLNYSPTATDGSEVAAGVLMTAVRQQDFQGTTQPKFWGILVGGPVQTARLLGLDAMAMQQMDKFQFDAQLSGVSGFMGGFHWYPWRRFQNKTANYVATTSDNFTQFTNTGATGEVDITLPAIANGLRYGILATAAQTFKIISNEGGNIVAFNNATANSLSLQTGGSIIGGGIEVWSNAAATLWFARTMSAGANTITVA
jgi:hypothetical protein